MTLFTVGYEGLQLPQLLRLLVAYGIETLVDVRERPLSRKPGFSKTALGNAVSEYGIKYHHVRELGCPTPIRHQLRLDSDWDRYTIGFLDYLNGQEDSLEDLDQLTRRSRCALLCFEADAQFCHRSLVAERLRRVFNPGLEIIHITINLTPTKVTLPPRSPYASAPVYQLHL